MTNLRNGLTGRVTTYDEAIAAAAEVYLEAKFRIETEKALAAIGLGPDMRPLALAP